MSFLDCGIDAQSALSLSLHTQLVREILRNKEDHTKVKIIFANVTEEDILLRGELEAIARESPQVELFYTLERPPAGWSQGVRLARARACSSISGGAAGAPLF